jgi:hypothetical protein
MAHETVREIDVTSILTPQHAPEGRTSIDRIVSETMAKTGVRLQTAKKIAQISTTPDCNILSDLPVAEDTFGFSLVARTVSNIILSDQTQTPLSIAIDGSWGSGKTSLLKMIEAQVRTLGTPCLWVNAWSFENSENLIATMADQVRAEIKRTYLESHGFWEAFLTQLWVTLSTISEKLTVLPMGGIFAELLRAQVKYGKEVTAVASVVAARKSFENLIEVLLDNSKHLTSRVVVFIDDLDRALPDQIVTILKNLKLVLEAKGCVFVLAMDVDLVAGSIEAYYQRETITKGRTKEIVEFGASYLEKITQLRVKVPSLTRKVISRYLSEFGIIPDVAEIISVAPDHEVLNPRRLKRYVNWLSITMQLISSVQMPPSVRNITALKALALKRHHPELYHKILSDPLGESGLLERFVQHDPQTSLDELREFDRFLQEKPLLEVGELGLDRAPEPRRESFNRSLGRKARVTRSGYFTYERVAIAELRESEMAAGQYVLLEDVGELSKRIANETDSDANWTPEGPEK